MFYLTLSETLTSIGAKELTNPAFLPAFATGGHSIPTISELCSATTLDTKPEIPASSDLFGI